MAKIMPPHIKCHYYQESPSLIVLDPIQGRIWACVLVWPGVAGGLEVGGIIVLAVGQGVTHKAPQVYPPEGLFSVPACSVVWLSGVLIAIIVVACVRIVSGHRPGRNS